MAWLNPTAGSTALNGFLSSIFPSLTILNAASYVATQIAPGEIVALRGYGMGPASGLTPSSAKPPTQLGGASISFDGFAAPLLYVQSEQINAQAPWEIAGQGLATVQATFLGSTVQPATPVVVAPSLPGVFYVDNADGTVNSPTNPAAVGSTIAIYGTGGGTLSAPGLTGGYWGPSAPLATLTLSVVISVSGENAVVAYSGSAPTLESGFFQINATLPVNLSASTVSLVVTIGGTASAPMPIWIGTP